MSRLHVCLKLDVECVESLGEQCEAMQSHTAVAAGMAVINLSMIPKGAKDNLGGGTNTVGGGDLYQST